MSQINFPVATEDGQTFNAPNGVIYTYVGTPPNGYWSGTFQTEGIATLDGRYLKLDSSNDPVTGGLVVSTGNVGIGTNTPTQKLHVNGAIVAGGAASTYQTDGIYLQNTGSSVFDISAWRAGASASILTFSTDSGSDSAPIEQVRIDQNGNVGIGTNSPQAKLQVVNRQGGQEGRILFDADVSSGYDTRIDATNSGLEFTAESNTRGFRFNTGNPATSKVAVTADGSVGVGTNTPDSQLEVVSSVADTVESVKVVSVGAKGTSASIRSLTLYAPGPDANRVAKIAIENTASPFAIDVNSAERLRISTEGFVGIGTPSPSYRLHVKGADAGSSRLMCERTGDGAGQAIVGVDGNGNAVFGTNQSGQNITFYTSGTSPKVTVTDSGLVGIGEAAPDEPLVVKSASNRHFYVGEGINSNYTKIGAKLPGSGNKGYLEIHGYAINFYAENKDNAVTIDPNGRLGVGTSPVSGSSLDVAGTTILRRNSTQYIEYVGDGSGNQISSYSSSTNAKDLLIINTTNGKGHVFRVTDSSGTTQTPLVLFGTGAIQLPWTAANFTTANAANVHMSAGGTLYLSTSSRKYKTDITPIDSAASHALLDMSQFHIDRLEQMIIQIGLGMVSLLKMLRRLIPDLLLTRQLKLYTMKRAMQKHVQLRLNLWVLPMSDLCHTYCF